MKKRILFCIAALVASQALTPHSFAQSSGMPMRGMMEQGCPMMGMMGQSHMGGGMMGGGGMMRGRGMHRFGMNAMAEGGLAFLKTELKITDDQEAAWNDFAEATRNRISLMKGMRESMMETMDEGTALERMDARINAMEAMVEAMKAVKPAAEKLYAGLSADQKKVADDLIGMGCGAM